MWHLWKLKLKWIIIIIIIYITHHMNPSENMFLQDFLWQYVNSDARSQVSRLVTGSTSSLWTRISSSAGSPSSSCWASAAGLAPSCPGWPTGTSAQGTSPSAWSGRAAPGCVRPGPPPSPAAHKHQGHSFVRVQELFILREGSKAGVVPKMYGAWWINNGRIGG